MLLHVIARGKVKGAEAELCERYAARLPWPVKTTQLPERGGRVPDAPPGSRTVVLDERGEALGSGEFAALLDGWRDEGVGETRFLLGGADGHAADLRKAADRVLSFGPATWPHLLARAMLMEQLYRATMILAGHPYHREG